MSCTYLTFVVQTSPESRRVSINIDEGPYDVLVKFQRKRRREVSPMQDPITLKGNTFNNYLYYIRIYSN